MNTIINICKLSLKSTILLLFSLSMSCSLSVPSASVPSDPPIVETKIFDSSRLVGVYTQDSAPQMFLWPILKTDPLTGEEVPMTLDEQAASRQKIIFSVERLQFYESALEKEADAIEQKYDFILKDLVDSFKERRCYSYCDPEDFIFCDPNNEDALFVEEWLVSDDPEINEIIRICQDNQNQRKGLDDKKKEETDNKLGPLQEKSRLHAQNFFGELGDNRYGNLSLFELVVADETLLVGLEFGNVKLSNDSQEPEDLSIVDVQFDSIEGYLSFRTAAVSPDGDVIGEMFYDLELTFTEDGNLSIAGDVRFSQEGKEERVGRFSSKGTMN